jgi:hypothetical protein
VYEWHPHKELNGSSTTKGNNRPATRDNGQLRKDVSSVHISALPIIASTRISSNVLTVTSGLSPSSSHPTSIMRLSEPSHRASTEGSRRRSTQRTRSRSTSSTSTTPTSENRTAFATGHKINAQRRLSGGHVTGPAATAKFGNRLRTYEEGDGDTVPLRAASRARQSLPPAMAARPTRALTPTDRNASRPGSALERPSQQSRPLWNSSTKPSEKPSAPRITDTYSVTNNRNLGAKRDKASSASRDEVIGLWPTYRDTLGEDAVRKPSPVGRNLGGKI